MAVTHQAATASQEGAPVVGHFSGENGFEARKRERVWTRIPATDLRTHPHPYFWPPIGDRATKQAWDLHSRERIGCPAPIAGWGPCGPTTGCRPWGTSSRRGETTLRPPRPLPSEGDEASARARPHPGNGGQVVPRRRSRRRAVRQGDTKGRRAECWGLEPDGETSRWTSKSSISPARFWAKNLNLRRPPGQGHPPLVSPSPGLPTPSPMPLPSSSLFIFPCRLATGPDLWINALASPRRRLV